MNGDNKKKTAVFGELSKRHSGYVPFGEYTRRFIGFADTPFSPCVKRSVSSSISLVTSSKFVYFFPGLCLNSAYSLSNEIYEYLNEMH